MCYALFVIFLSRARCTSICIEWNFETVTGKRSLLKTHFFMIINDKYLNFTYSFYTLSCIQYCSNITAISFCCLTNRYWFKKNKITPMLYTEYTTKHSAACRDVAINSTSGTWLSFNLSVVYQIWYNGNGSGLVIQVSWVRVPLWVSNFHFVILALRSLQLE